MKGKKILTITLLAFVLAGVIFLIFKETKSGRPQASPAGTVSGSKPQIKEQDKKSRGNEFVVYYFHGSKRCPTCNLIEKLTDKAVTENFAKQLKSGKLLWKSVNTDLAENRHFTEDYKLEYQSVILSQVKDGKEVSWKNLDQVWQLVRDEPAFLKYVKSEIEKSMGANNE